MWGSGSGKPVKALLAVPSSPAAAKHHYFSTAKADDPLAFPAASDAVIAKFPPTLFVTGSRAMEMSSAIVSHAQMLRLGVDSQLYMIEGGGTVRSSSPARTRRKERRRSPTLRDGSISTWRIEWIVS